MTVEKAKITEEIKSLLKKIHPLFDDVFHGECVEKMVDYFEELDKSEHPTLQWDFLELQGVEYLNMAAEKIKYEMIEPGTNKDSYLGMACSIDLPPGESPRNEFERGVCSAIGFIRFLVHCMNPG